MNKKELKEQLYKMSIPVYGNNLKISKKVLAKIIKVFAGDVLKLSDHPQYRKEMQKRERDRKNKEIIDRMNNKNVIDTPVPQTPLDKKIIEKFSQEHVEEKFTDEDLENFLMNWFDDTVYSYFTLCLDRGHLDLALDYLIESDEVSTDTKKNPQNKSIVERWEKAKDKIKKQKIEILRNVEVWESGTGGKFYVDMDIADPADVKNLKFIIGYDINGKKYSDSLLTKGVG
jgi:hypothetical protein